VVQNFDSGGQGLVHAWRFCCLGISHCEAREPCIIADPAAVAGQPDFGVGDCGGLRACYSRGTICGELEIFFRKHQHLVQRRISQGLWIVVGGLCLTVRNWICRPSPGRQESRHRRSCKHLSAAGGILFPNLECGRLSPQLGRHIKNPHLLV